MCFAVSKQTHLHVVIRSKVMGQASWGNTRSCGYVERDGVAKTTWVVAGRFFFGWLRMCSGAFDTSWLNEINKINK